MSQLQAVNPKLQKPKLEHSGPLSLKHELKTLKAPSPNNPTPLNRKTFTVSLRKSRLTLHFCGGKGPTEVAKLLEVKGS